MKSDSKVLVFLATAGMELCYLYACTNFLTTIVFHHTFPFPEAVGSFLAAALLTLFADGRGWRMIFVLGVQSLAFIPALVRLVLVFNSWSDAFVSLSWFTEFPMGPLELVWYFTFLLVVVWFFVFWNEGVELARRSKDYAAICSRFDRGLFAFFVLFLVKIYLQAQVGIAVEDPMSGTMLFPFMVFSLLDIGLVRNQSADQKDFMPGYRQMGVILGFIVVVLLLGTGVVFFFLPYLTFAAEAGYSVGSNVLNSMSTPIIALVLTVWNWLFGTDYKTTYAPQDQDSQVNRPTSQSMAPWWVDLLGTILGWGMIILSALVILLFIIVSLSFLFRTLISKTAVDPEKQGLLRLVSSVVARLRALLLSLGRILVRRVKSSRGAIELYAALVMWGRRSGLPHCLSETPTEYGFRLRQRFPMLEREIELIVESFNRQVYGEVLLDDQQLTSSRFAWRTLASPLQWHLRIKPWFHRSSGHSDSPR